MAIDKSTKQHYEMQGKVKNYLGKQKMVKAPVKWKSGPDHPDTELAYITKAEKDLILKADLHSSLSNGPNRGPSGIISLNSAGSGYGGPGPGRGGDGPGPQSDFRSTTQHTYSAPTSTTPSRSRHESVVEEKAKQQLEQLTNRNVTSFKGPVVTTKKKDDLGFEDKKAIAIQKAINPDVYAGVKTGDASRAETIAKEDDKISEKEEERGYTDKGEKIEYFGDKPVTRKTAFNLGLLEKNIKTGEIQQGRNIINPFTQEIQSKFAPIDKPKKGLLGVLGNVALGILAPALLPAKLAKAYAMYNQAKNISKLASTFTGKDYVGDLTTNLRSNIKSDLFSGKRSTIDTTTDTRDDRFGQGDRQAQAQAIAPKRDVITESVEKFSPRQMDLVRQRHEQLQQVMESGEYMGQRLNNNQLASLQNASKQMEAFLVDPQKMMMARGGLAGLHG